MRRAGRAIVMVMGLLLAGIVPAFPHAGAEPRQAAAPPVFKLEKLSERAWCLFGQGGNVGFLVTDEGVIVVDDQFDQVAEGILQQIKSVTDRPVRYLINTHYHEDHTGGNRVFAKQADIIAHQLVRPRMLEYPRVVQSTFPARMKAMEAEIATLPGQDPWRVALEKDLGLMKFFLDASAAFNPATVAAPRLTFDNEMRIFLGGEEVRIFHVAPGHTDGDSMVYFRNQNVLHMGDLFFNGMYPFVDTDGGGSVRGYIENIDRALSTIPADARVIPGHGPVTDMAGLRRTRSFFADLIVEVEKAARAGMSRPDAVRAIKLDAYPEIKPAFRTLGNVVSAAYEEIRPKP